MSNISEKTHEFRQGPCQCLMSAVRYLLQTTDTIDDKRMNKSVKDRISLSKMNLSNDMDKDNKVIRKTCDQITKMKTTDNEDQLEALVSICRKIFAVIFITKKDETIESLSVRYYTKDYASFQQCVYLIYDETNKYYYPLYLSNKTNPDEIITIFDSKDPVIKNLLRRFFKEILKYDQTDTVVSEIPPRIQNESDKISDIITVNTAHNGIDKQMTAKGDECVMMPNSTMKTSDSSEDDRQLLGIKTTISNKTHEFRIGELPGDDQCLFSSVSYLLDRSQTINIKSLRKKVANYILQSKDIDDMPSLCDTICQTREDYCLKIEDGSIRGFESERRALVSLYPNIFFCIISKMEDDNQSLVWIDNYVSDGSSYKKCIIIVNDVVANNYIPLYLYNKISQEEENISFKYDDSIKALLGEFIRTILNHHGYINFDSDKTYNEVDPDCRIEPESVNVIDKIAENAATNILTILQLEKHTNHGKKPSIERVSSSKIPRHNFGTSRKFCQRAVDSDGHCLYASLCFLLHHMGNDVVKNLREEVSDFILQWNNVNDEVLYSDSGKNRKEYCNDIKNTNIWGGELEIRAIGKLYGVIIRIVIPREVNSEVLSVCITELPENEPSFQKCVYIIYVRHTHYEPLYVHNGDHSKEEKTMFDRDDTTVNILLQEFIHKKFGYCGPIVYNNEAKGDGLERYARDKSANELDLTGKHEKNTLVKKRKTPDDESSIMTDATKKLTPSIRNAAEVMHIQPSIYLRAIPSNDHVCKHHQGSELPNSIEQLLQTNHFPTVHSSTIQLMDQQELPSNILSTNTIVSYPAQNQYMRFETEPIQIFRGRFLSDFNTKKGNKNGGTRSDSIKPSYFPDLQNRHYLNLLIPQTHLVDDLHRIRLEIRIVTQTINDCIYTHPYFKIYDVRRNATPCTVNPLLINLESDELHELKEYSEGTKNMLLYLPVVMLKNDDLLRNQPIELFQSFSSNQQVITRIYDHWDEYKADFHLNKLRFAATLLIENTCDGKYYPRLDLRYISQTSTQDKDFKISKANIL